MDINVANILATVKGLWMHDYHIINSWCFLAALTHAVSLTFTAALALNMQQKQLCTPYLGSDFRRLYVKGYTIFTLPGKLRLLMFSYHQFSASKYQFHVSFNCILLECLI